MSTITLQDSLILLRCGAGGAALLLAILVVVGLSLLAWAALWASAVGVAAVLSH
jgi:hypothetical protein